MKSLRVIPATVILLLSVVGAAEPAAAQPSSGPRAFICTGGDIRAGSYSSVLVKGVCYMPSGTVVVQHDLTVGPKALLDAITPGDPPGSNAQLPATVVVGGNVNVGAGAVLLLGCSPDQSCNGGVNYDRVAGNLTAVGDLGIVVHSATIGGDVSLLGGGGGVAGGDFEDATIAGNYTVAGIRTCWLGTFRTRIGGNTTWVGNQTSDPDGNELAANNTTGSMICLSNRPANQFGDSGGSPNVVGDQAKGQCGFNVSLPKTPPESSTPVTHVHFTARASSLKTFVGVHTQIANVQSSSPVTTVSGDTLTVDINNAVLAGRGLTGPITYDPTAPTGTSTGETVWTTTHPNDSASFTTQDVCACKFQGRSGNVTIEATGTGAAKGFTRGTFVIRYAEGGLARLAGWGTFTSAHQPPGSLLIVEHLAVT